jgi:hypothetical protein
LTKLWQSFLEETSEELLLAEEKQRTYLSKSARLEPDAKFAMAAPAFQPNLIQAVPQRHSSMAVLSSYILGNLAAPPLSPTAIPPLSAPLPSRPDWFQAQQAEILDTPSACSDRHGWFSDSSGSRVASTEFNWSVEEADPGMESELPWMVDRTAKEELVEYGWAT